MKAEPTEQKIVTVSAERPRAATAQVEGVGPHDNSINV
jgi:hypothetical protein